MTTGAKRVVSMIEELGVDLSQYKGPFAVRRTRAGHWQRSAGAWSWYLVDAEENEVVGSCESMTSILRDHSAGRVATYRNEVLTGASLELTT